MTLPPLPAPLNTDETRQEVMHAVCNALSARCRCQEAPDSPMTGRRAMCAEVRVATDAALGTLRRVLAQG